jgi:hypothetical protein
VKARRRVTLAVVIAAVAAAAVACGSGASPGPSTSVRARVEYQVTGRAPSITVIYGNRRHHRQVAVALPWSHVGGAISGTTVVLSASQASSNRGYRLVCVLSVAVPGQHPLVSRDSSHIVGIKAEGGPQQVLYDGQCNTQAAVPTAG